MAETEKTTNGGDDALLESFFEAGRAAPPLPPADLVARILADAGEEMRPAGTMRAVFARLRDGVGGWPALAGLASAACVGLWLGFAQPAMIDTLAGGALGLAAGLSDYGLDDLAPIDAGLGELLSEG